MIMSYSLASTFYTLYLLSTILTSMFLLLAFFTPRFFTFSYLAYSAIPPYNDQSTPVLLKLSQTLATFTTKYNLQIFEIYPQKTKD